MFFISQAGKFSLQRGDIAVYMALLVLSIVLSSALVFSLILSRQIKGAEDVIMSERALYAASTSIEKGLFIISKEYETNVTVSGTIDYTMSGGTHEPASFDGQGWRDKNTGSICYSANGSFRQLARHFKMGPADCDPAG